MGQRDMFKNTFKGMTGRVTGHTGFKGSWLSLWLTRLGANVIGYSAYLPSEPCNFEASGIESSITHIEADIRDIDMLNKAFAEHKPDIVFHLAAQALVRKSINEPRLTFETNLMGMVNILECLRESNSVKVAVLITSDKCYQNLEWPWGYRETDRLGGDDPYSASKAAAENAVHAYTRTFFNEMNGGPNICTARAGNVIGGGDWAADRIVPDCIRAWSQNDKVIIRNPGSTRPWQHVLEPLSGYLLLGSELYGSNELHGEAFNFGPGQEVMQPVGELVKEFSKHWENVDSTLESEDNKDKKEAGLLKLSTDKALIYLGWKSVLGFEDTVRYTAEWYRKFYSSKGVSMRKLSLEQIELYCKLAEDKRLKWTGEAE